MNNEKRVLAQNKVVQLISGGRESGDLGRYLRAQAIQPLLPAKFRGNYADNVLIFKSGQSNTYGLEASDVIDICKAYMRARTNGTLKPSQARLAEQAEMIVLACAKTGIDAIVDEATGYQHFRKANELQEKLQSYLQEEYREWTLTFPREFFMQLYKLEGKVAPMPLTNYPKRFGKYVMRFVYDTLDSDVAKHLRENNPNPSGKTHHHQLFNDFGYNNLSQHLMSIIGIMKASTTLERFNSNISIAFPGAKAKSISRRKKPERKSKEIKNKGGQTQITFDYIPTVNTPQPGEKKSQYI